MASRQRFNIMFFQPSCTVPQFGVHISWLTFSCSNVFNVIIINSSVPAFQYYILPTLMYCAPVWSPHLLADIQLLERVQRRYNKFISGLGQYNLNYENRLRELAALLLQNRRLYAEMATVYKSLHGLMRCPSSSLHLAVSNTRNKGKRLVQQRPISRVHSALFCCRAPTHWNSLPSSINDCARLAVFKKKLYAFLLANQLSTLMDFILLTLQSMH